MGFDTIEINLVFFSFSNKQQIKYNQIFKLYIKKIFQIPHSKRPFRGLMKNVQDLIWANNGRDIQGILKASQNKDINFVGFCYISFCFSFLKQNGSRFILISFIFLAPTLLCNARGSRSGVCGYVSTYVPNFHVADWLSSSQWKSFEITRGCS